MDFTDTSATGNEINLRLYDTPLGPGLEANIYDDRNPWETDNRKFKDKVSIPHWRELVLVRNGWFHTLDPDLVIKVATSYHLQALQEGLVHDITPLSINGIIVTKDDKLVYGIRGGQVRTGKANIVPGGRVTADSIKPDPIFGSFSTFLPYCRYFKVQRKVHENLET